VTPLGGEEREQKREVTQREADADPQQSLAPMPATLVGREKVAIPTAHPRELCRLGDLCPWSSYCITEAVSSTRPRLSTYKAMQLRQNTSMGPMYGELATRETERPLGKAHTRERESGCQV
jgi:hypothetical protein